MSLASLTYFTHFSDDSLADFEQVNVSWEFVKFLFVEILEIQVVVAVLTPFVYYFENGKISFKSEIFNNSFTNFSIEMYANV